MAITFTCPSECRAFCLVCLAAVQFLQLRAWRVHSSLPSLSHFALLQLPVLQSSLLGKRIVSIPRMANLLPRTNKFLGTDNTGYQFRGSTCRRSVSIKAPPDLLNEGLSLLLVCLLLPELPPSSSERPCVSNHRNSNLCPRTSKCRRVADTAFQTYGNGGTQAASTMNSLTAVYYQSIPSLQVAFVGRKKFSPRPKWYWRCPAVRR